MDYLVQKVAYLKGLADGLGINDTTNEGKLLLQIVETLEDFTDVIADTIEDQMDLEEYVNFIDEDLADIEEDIYGVYDEDEFDFDEFDFDDFCDEDCCTEFEDEEEEEE